MDEFREAVGGIYIDALESPGCAFILAAAAAPPRTATAEPRCTHLHL